MGFERNYPIKIPSKQLNILSFSTFINKQNAMAAQSESNNNRILNPWFITGIVDAEGCFQIKIREDMRQTLNWRVSSAFQIKLHIKDIAILENIKNTLCVGTITKDSLNMATYNVWSVKELQVIVNHFDKYPLITARFLIFYYLNNVLKSLKNENI